MAINKTYLKDLLVTSLDGEWGKGEGSSDFVKMSVIRGTDFPSVRYGDLTTVPTRYIPERIAKRKVLQEGDILLETAGGSKDRPTGRTLLIKKTVLEQREFPITCASFSRFLRINCSIAEPAYIFWYLQFLYETGQMEQHQTQHTGVARFQYTKFASDVKIPIPPIEEQKAIASILGSLDDKIALNHQMNETLETMARAVFKSWFVDFDPIPGLGPHKEWQDSPLGRIPKGWRVKTLGELCEITMGQSPPGETYNETGEGVPFYQGIRDFGSRFPSRRVYCTAPTRLAQEGDVLLSVRAPVGTLNIAGEGCAIGRGVAALKIKRQHYGFLYYLMQATKSGWEKFESEGTVFGSVGKSDLQKFRVVCPQEQVMGQFNELVYPIDQKIKVNINQSRTLATIRDALLPKLLSGEIRVKDAKKFTGKLL